MKKMKKLITKIKAIYYTYFRRTEIFKMVRAFRRANGDPIVLRPEAPSDERVRLYAGLIAEEAFETVGAMYGHDGAFMAHKEAVMQLIRTLPPAVDMVEVVDGLGDVDYVVENARQEFGIDGLPIADEIQRTNMAKFEEDSWIRESDGKRMKPPGWTPPDIAGRLAKQGWVNPEGDPTE